MIDSSLQNELIKEVEQLPPALQRKVVEYAHSLKSTTPEGTPGRELLRFAGIMSKEDAEEMMKIIEEGCEQINYEGWDLQLP
jgi:hypothetical protein